MADRRAIFLEGNLFRHISVMALTSSVGLMAVFAVDFIDMIFISMLVNAELAAAVGYAGAILFFTTSFGIGMAIAAGALAARALGQGDEELARAQAAASLVWGVVFGTLFAAAVWVNIGALAALMEATGETLDLAVHYLQIIVPSLPFLIVGMVGGAILRAHGDARWAMRHSADPDLSSPWRAGEARHSGAVQSFATHRDHRSSRDPDAAGLALGSGLCHSHHGQLRRGGSRGDGHR